MRFTTLPFLIAFLAGLPCMRALDIYDFHVRNHGTEQTEPWRSTRTAGLARVSRLFARLLASLWPHRQAAIALACALLVATLAPPHLQAHGGVSICIVGAVGGIRQLIQAEADSKAAMVKAKAPITKLKTEGRTLTAIPSTAIAATATTPEVKARTPEQSARMVAILAELNPLEDALAALEDAHATIEADLAVARRFQDDERHNPSIIIGKNHEEKPITLGQFLQGIAYTMTGKASLLSPEVVAAVSGASSGAPTDGGFLVRADWNTSLLNKMATAGVLAPRCLTIPIGPESDGIEAPYVNETSRATGSRWGGVQVYRAAEAASVTASKPGLGKFELRLDDLMGLFYATDRLLRDTTALEAIAMKAFPSEFAFKLDDEIVRGDGAGQCLGILNAPATVSQAKETNQSAATIVSQNVIKMYARMLASAIGGSFWAINQECLPQLQQMYVAVGTGGQLVYMPPNGLVDAPFGTLLGRPVVPIEQASGLGTVGDIMFLSLAENYVLIDKPMTSASSEHVRFLFNEKTFKWVYPIIGRPLLQSAITPYKATTATTLSPFITLATRA